jgi:hypothetical protein
VKHGLVPYVDIVADYERGFFRDMEDAAVLDIAVVSQRDGIGVGPRYRVEPYADVISQRDIANEGGVWRDVAVGADFNLVFSETVFHGSPFLLLNLMYHRRTWGRSGIIFRKCPFLTEKVLHCPYSPVNTFPDFRIPVEELQWKFICTICP